MELKGQTAVVTGANSGIGLAITKTLMEKGVNVVACDQSTKVIRNEARCHPVALDVTDENAVKEAVERAFGLFGRIDILVNAAGITGITNMPSYETQTNDVSRVMEVNFMGSYFTSKYVLPGMLDRRYGRVLHIASIAGKEGNAGMLAYSASKAAVIAMAKVQGKECAGTGVTVNALAPAVIRTALVDAMPPEQVKYMTDKIPMGRCGTLEEVSQLVCYVVSPQNSFTTGFTFDLSGGRATY